ncbi:hypothetical protein ACFB49_42470 [Sphingomonas sp. DBB INV C78]|uniref:hypothetical protein n=1 Tax=Sphingomonas sp. DBB INV C78 TaxID=3349434 RepID=UPI0036D33835
MLGVVIQIDGWDPVAGAAVTLRASSVNDAAVCHLNGQTWWPAIAQLPTLAYDLFDGGFGGAISTPAANLALVVEPFPNLPRYMLADARIQLWTGEVGDAWASWTQRFDGRLKAQPTVADGIANITFAVDDRWLDQPLLTTYAGTTGAEGPAALKGTVKPLALGAPRYVEGVLVDPTNNVFQVSGYGLIEDVEVALERLARFGASASDYASYAALVAASIPPGRWATSKAVGMVRFGAPPAGQISFLVKGDKAGPNGWARKPGQLIRRLALLAGGTGKIDDASLNALDAARPYNVSLYAGAQATARELIQSIAASVNAVAGVTWMGKLFVAPVGIGAPSLTYQADGSALPPVAKVDQLEMAAPWWKLAIEAERTETVHGMGDVAFTAELIDMGAYVSTATYREGNIVQNQNSSWLYINPTPTAGNAPPTLPTTSNAYWKVLAKAGDTGAQGPNGADPWRAIFDPTYYSNLGGGDFQRIAATGWSGQYIRSNEKISNGARVSFTPPLLGEAVVGMHRTTTPAVASEWVSIDVAWHKAPAGMTAVNRLGGTLSTGYPAAAANDIYEVQYRETSATAGIVEWLKNGAVVQSYVTTAGLGFYFFSTIASLNVKIESARFASLGAAGADGLSIAELTIYRRATSAPAVPSGGSYNFATGVLTPPSGWSATVPAGNDPCYAASGVAAIQGSAGTDTPDWLGVGLAFQEGAATNVVFRRSATQPATPGASSGTPASWYDSTGSVPAGADPIWASYGSRPNAGANWTWQTPKRVEGQDGLSVAELTIYRRGTSAPATPTGGSYNFGTKVLTPPSGWSNAIPAGNDPCYASSGFASIQGTTGTDTPDWLGVALAFQEGASTNIVFRRSATQPATPSASAGTPASWYDSTGSVPAGADPIWASYGSRPNAGANWTWQTPKRVEGADGTPGDPGLSIAVTPGHVQVAAAVDGTPKSGVLPKTAQIILFAGTTSVVESASYSITPSGCAATVSNTAGTRGRITVTDVTTDTAYADITATYSGYSITQRLPVPRTRDGASAQQGGPAGTVLRVVLSPGQSASFEGWSYYIGTTTSGTMGYQLQRAEDSGSPSYSAFATAVGNPYGPSESVGNGVTGSFTNTSGVTKSYLVRGVPSGQSGTLLASESFIKQTG